MHLCSVFLAIVENLQPHLSIHYLILKRQRLLSHACQKQYDQKILNLSNIIPNLFKQNLELLILFKPWKTMIMSGIHLNDAESNDIKSITMWLFFKKKYDWLGRLYSSQNFYNNLIQWSRETDSVGLKKSSLLRLLKIVYDWTELPLLENLKRYL